LSKRRKAPSLAITDAFAAAPDGPGIRLHVAPGRYLFIERMCIFSVLTSLVLYVIAAFLANEWLYLLSVALMLSAALSIVYPLLIINSIEADAWLPEQSTASDGVEIIVKIRQRRMFGPLMWLLPLSFLRVRAILARRTIGGYQPDDEVAQQALCLGDCGHEISIQLRIPVVGRGVFKLSHLDVATCMPFGLAWGIGRVNMTEDMTKTNSLVVMPQFEDLRGEFLGTLNGIYSPVGLRFANVRAFTQSSSVRGLRDFRTGDSLRHIHWPSSARQNRLMVREFDSETLPVFNIYLDLASRWQNRAQFELAISTVYSLVRFGHDHDILPEVFINPPITSEELEELMFDLPQMKAPLETMSEILARVEPLPYSGSANKHLPDTRYQMLSVLPTKDTVLVAGGKSSPLNVVVIDPDAPLNSGACIATIYGSKDLEAL
jgi:hypothetical protein